MKKLWIYGLILCMVLLCFSACGKGDVTPTDTTVTPTGNDGSAVGFSDEAEREEKLQTQKTDQPQQSETASLPQEQASRKIPFAAWNADTYQQYTWQASAVAKELPTRLCRSQAELSAYLKENALPEEYASQYTDEYFTTNSLLLFYGASPCQGDLWLVQNVTARDTTLQVSLAYHARGVLTMAEAHLYRIELADKLEQIQTVEMTVTKFDRDGNQIKE